MESTMDKASHKVKQVGRSIESSVGNLKNMMSSISLVGDAKHFGTMSDDDTKKLKLKLISKNEKDKLEGMKKIVAMMTLDRDVSILFADIIKLVCVESMEVKKLVYMYIVKYASSNSDLALLAISSFQKDMSSPNPFVRAKALQAMSSMNVSTVNHLIIMELKKAVKDSSEYVRKTCSQILPIVYKMDNKSKSELILLINILLNDDNVIVLSGAIYSYNYICPNNFDLIHSNFKKICHLLADMDEYGQIVALELLMRYCRNQFKSPFINNDDENELKNKENNTENKNEDNEDDDDEYFNDNNKLDLGEIELDPDHKAIINCVKNLIYSMNSQVVLSCVILLYYCAPIEYCNEAISSLMSFVSSKREISFSILTNISSMCTNRPELFQSFYKEFFIKSIEPRFIKELKLDILSKIANDSNINNILKEFQTYSLDNDIKFRCNTIDALGRLVACTSNTNTDDISELTMKLLMNLVSKNNQCEQVVGSSIIVIRQIIQRNPNKYNKSILSLLKLLSKTNVPKARCAIIWIIGEYKQYISNYAPDALRILSKTFINESNIVKMQILNLSVKLYLSNPTTLLQKLFKHILNLCKYDKNYDLRDRARLIKFIFFPKKKKKIMIIIIIIMILII